MSCSSHIFGYFSEGLQDVFSFSEDFDEEESVCRLATPFRFCTGAKIEVTARYTGDSDCMLDDGGQTVSLLKSLNPQAVDEFLKSEQVADALEASATAWEQDKLTCAALMDGSSIVERTIELIETMQYLAAIFSPNIPPF